MAIPVWYMPPVNTNNTSNLIGLRSMESQPLNLLRIIITHIAFIQMRKIIGLKKDSEE